MKPSIYLTAAILSLGVAALAVPSAHAVVISKIYVGTLSNPVSADPSLLVRGGKYVVKTSFDTDNAVLLSTGARLANPLRDMHIIPLTDVPGAAGATNTYELFLPTQGYGTLSQTGPDHFAIGAGFAPTAEIQFFAACDSEASCDAAFRGFEFESNYLRTNSSTTPAATDLIFEQSTSDANFGGTTVTNYVVSVLDQGFGNVTSNSGHVDVLSESVSASGGQLNPGVFFGEAVEVVAEAGATPLLFSATQQTVTTDAGTEQVSDPVVPPSAGTLRTSPSSNDQQPRQADNDLGAGRTDKEDFLDFNWTVNGNSLAGSLDGTRLDRVVETLSVVDPNTQPHGSRFVNNGTRSVENVNIAVAIKDSGLTTTVDTTGFSLAVNEAMTGKSDTDSIAVSYQNAAVTSADAGPNLVYDAANLTRTANGSVVDPDLAINAKIADFEAHAFDWSQGVNPLGTTEDLVLGIVASGLSTTISTSTIDLTATDRAGTSQSDSTTALYANALPTISSASATAQGSGMLFELDYDDVDLAVNALIAGFEDLLVAVSVDAVDQTGFFSDLISNGTQLVDQLTLEGIFGLGPHQFDVLVTDLAGATAAANFQFEVTQGAAVPEPPMLAMFALGLAGLAGRLRCRRPRALALSRVGS